MDYRKYGNRIILRLDPGDEICERILGLAEKENIRLGSVSGIGGSDNITVGVYNPEKKEYSKYHLTGTHEITSLNGNITQMNGLPYVHIHITVAGKNGAVSGGHLLKAVISLTAELTIDIFEGEADRKRNERLGINEIDFAEAKQEE